MALFCSLAVLSILVPQDLFSIYRVFRVFPWGRIPPRSLSSPAAFWSLDTLVSFGALVSSGAFGGIVMGGKDGVGDSGARGEPYGHELD